MQINVNDIQSVVYDGQEVEHFYVGADLVWEKPSGATPLTFTNAQSSASTVKIQQTGTDTSGKVIYYRLNGGAETQYTMNTEITLESQGDYVQFYSKDEIAMCSSTSIYKKFVMTGSIEGSGDLQSLMNYAYNLTGKNYCYYNMFRDCSALVTAPELTATTLGLRCYYNMFNGCSSLVTAPELPATTLASYCYLYMFNGCSSLVDAPELPATTLASSCYSYMFSGCSALVTAPELPATTLTVSCYSNMFEGCSSLITAPELPVTTLQESCYSKMFNGCSSLVDAPELPATTLAGYCYSNMFKDCSSLVTAPELPATTLTYYCYRLMFSGCSSLITAPELPATTLAEYCYYGMFEVCSSLVTAPELPATTLALYCYLAMFSGCSSLVTAPELPATTLTGNCYSYMFSGCSALVTAPELPSTTLAYSCYSYMFRNCTSLNEIYVGATNLGSYTSTWLLNVAPTGTVHFLNGLDAGYTPSRDASGVPSGWTYDYPETEPNKIYFNNIDIWVSDAKTNLSDNTYSSKIYFNEEEEDVGFVTDNYSYHNNYAEPSLRNKSITQDDYFDIKITGILEDFDRNYTHWAPKLKFNLFNKYGLEYYDFNTFDFLFSIIYDSNFGEQKLYSEVISTNNFQDEDYEVEFDVSLDLDTNHRDITIRVIFYDNNNECIPGIKEIEFTQVDA